MYICYMDTLLFLIDAAVISTSGQKDRRESIKDMDLEEKYEKIHDQNKALDALHKQIKITNNETQRLKKYLEQYPDKSTQGLEGYALRNALFNRAQRVRILLSFYINKLGDGDKKDLLIASKRKYNKDPNKALNKLILKNDNDLKKIRTYLSLNTYTEKEIRQIQRKRKLWGEKEKEAKRHVKREEVELCVRMTNNVLMLDKKIFMTHVLVLLD